MPDSNPITGAMIGVVKRCREITIAQKYLWLDLVPYWRTGCWKSPAVHAVDIDLSESAIDKGRRLFAGVGLARSEPRLPPGRRGPGRPRLAWFAAWPEDLGPLPARRLSTDEVARLAARLGDLVEAYHRSTPEGGENPDPCPEIMGCAGGGRNPPLPDRHPETFPYARPDSLASVAGGAPRGEGGKGGGAGFSFQDVSPGLSTHLERKSHSSNEEMEKPTPEERSQPARASDRTTHLPSGPLNERLTAWEQRMRSTV